MCLLKKMKVNKRIVAVAAIAAFVTAVAGGLLGYFLLYKK